MIEPCSVKVVVDGNGQLLDPTTVEICVVRLPDRVIVLAGPQDDPDRVTGGEVTVEPCSVIVLAGPQDEAGNVTVEPCSVIVLAAGQMKQTKWL
jgi:hypothetical protein